MDPIRTTLSLPDGTQRVLILCEVLDPQAHTATQAGAIEYDSWHNAGAIEYDSWRNAL